MFSWATQGWEELLSFFETGGDVLIAIFFVTMVMWAIIVERFSYLKAAYPQEAKETLAEWHGRSDKDSWHAQQIQVQLMLAKKRRTPFQ